jgi:hypothetical protein
MIDLSTTLTKSYNHKKKQLTHLIKITKVFINQEKNTTKKKKGIIASQFSIIYETYTRTRKMGKRVKKHQECALFLNSGDVKKVDLFLYHSISKIVQIKKIQNLHQQFRL